MTVETDWGDTATSQWTPGAIRGWKRQDRVLLEPSVGAQLPRHPDFRHLFLRTLREYILLF